MAARIGKHCSNMASNRWWITGACLVLALAFRAQAQNRYVVHFTDKNGTPYTVGEPEAFLSQRAIDRRARQGIAVANEDLPVTPSYVDQIRNLGITTAFQSKWLNAVLVEADPSQIPAISALSFVEMVEYVAPGPLGSSAPGPPQANRTTSTKQVNRTLEEASAFQNMMLGLDELYEEGWDGAGISIAVMDGGFTGVDTSGFFSHLYANNRIKQTYDYLGGSSDVYRYSDHGTEVLSIMAAFEPGEYVGGAVGSDYFLYVTDDECTVCEYRIEEYNLLFATESADSAGVDLVNYSLGYNLFEDPSMDYSYADMDGRTAVSSLAATIASSKGIVAVMAAGNEGNLPWRYITAPADAIDVLSVGRVNSTGSKTSSSSVGPSADGRIKPELVALGTGVRVINGAGSVSSASGTSFSAPQVTALAASLWQAHPELSALELMFLIRQSSDNAETPNNDIGYGIPNARAALNLLEVIESGRRFSVYPNPLSNGRLVIRSNNPAQYPTAKLEMFSTKGERILETSLTFSQTVLTQILDLSIYPAGLYILNLRTGDAVEKIRVAKLN